MPSYHTLEVSGSAGAMEACKFNLNVYRINEGVNAKAMMEQIEAGLVRKAMETTGGNKARAAKILGMNRTTFLVKLTRVNAMQAEAVNTNTVFVKES